MFQKIIILDRMIKQGISGVLKVRFSFCKAQLVRTNFLYPYQMLSFYEIKSFTRALRNTDHEVSVPKCPGKWLYFHTSVRSSVNICDHPNDDPSVRICNSETLRDTFAKLGTNIKHYQKMCTEQVLKLQLHFLRNYAPL